MYNDYMQYILFAIIILQFIYAVYKDAAFSSEREKLRKMIKSKDLVEYASVEQEEEESELTKEPSPYKPLDEVSTEEIIKADVKL